MLNFFKRLFARLTGRSTQITYLLLPITGLTIEFMFKVGDGKWEYGQCTMQEIYTHANRSVIGIHLDQLVNGLWGAAPRVTGYYHIKILKNKKQIVAAAKEMKEEGYIGSP